MKKILIMDDDTDLLAGLCIRLSAHGYATLVASDAAVAIQKMLQEKTDLVLLDIGLPDRKGFVVLDHVKQSLELGAVPVIIVSTRPSDVYRGAAVIAGATGYFEKPFNNEALFHAIQDALAPLARNPRSQRADFNHPKARRINMGKRKILIVDDHEDLSKALRIILRACDYDTAVAVDGASAISQAVNEKPDLIILDLGLPGGDGFAVMERLAGIESLAPIPIIVLSGNEAVRHKDRVLRAGAKAFFQKPADNAELMDCIKRLANESSAGTFEERDDDSETRTFV